MFSTSRLTKAEFIKTLKKPTIYIMAFVLLCVAAICIFIFNPVQRDDYRINYANQDTGVKVYNTFNGTGSNTRKDFDATISATDNAITFYSEYNFRNTEINNLYNSVIASYNALVTSNAESQNTAKEAYHKSLDDFYQYLSVNTSLNTISFISNAMELEYFQIQLSNLQTYNTYVAERNKEDIINDFSASKRDEMLVNVRDSFSNIIVETIDYYIQNALVAYNKFADMFVKGQMSVGTISAQDALLTTMQTNLTSLKTYIDNDLLKAGYPVIYINNNDYETFNDTFSEYVNKVINGTIGTASSQWQTIRRPAIETICKNNFVQTIKNSMGDITIVQVNQDIVKDLTNIQKKVISNKNTILEQIEKNKTKDSTTDILQNVTDYYLLSTTYKSLVNDVVFKQTTSTLSTAQIKALHGDDYAAYNEYQLNQNIALNRYKIDKNNYGQNTLNALGFNSVSGYEKNGYDYMFYAMSIITVVITIFAIMLTCTSLGSEQDSGTIKLLLIRPYSRTKILMSKLLAVLFYVIVFTLFSAITTFVAGWAVYGLGGGNVMMVFNAHSVVTIHPLLLMLIYILTIIFQVMFYVSIAFAMSTIFRSFAGSIVSSIVLYMGAITCTILLPNSLAYYILPFTNSYLFRYFGGAFATQSTTLSSLFAPPIYTSMTFLSSILISVGFMLIMYLISFLVFRKRDF